jgi:hypothetical protein
MGRFNRLRVSAYASRVFVAGQKVRLESIPGFGWRVRLVRILQVVELEPFIENQESGRNATFRSAARVHPGEMIGGFTIQFALVIRWDIEEDGRPTLRLCKGRRSFDPLA